MDSLRKKIIERIPKRIQGEALERRMPSYEKAIRVMWWILGGSILAVILTFFILSFTDLPTIEELENPRSELASEIYGSDGVEFGRYYVENRVPVDFKDLSPKIIQALVATEDERYFEHSGIDFRALGRVFVKTFLMGQTSSGGASTLTQQLAKLLFTEKPGSGIERVIQKLKEWIIALRLERRYTKEEIIAMYLNKFDFLYDSDGIKAAAETYFGKNQKELNTQEAALLVGMLKNPSLYNPRLRPESARNRRNVVFWQMERNDLLTQSQVDSLSTLPVDMTNFKRSNHATGLAPYFRMVLAELLKTDILKREECRKPDGTMYDIYRDGLKIYTTIDTRMQAIAEKTMVKHMANVQKNFWETWRKLDPWTYVSGSETEISVDLRKADLQRTLRESDRYNMMWDEYLTGPLERLNEEIGEINLGEDDIERIVNEEKEKGSLGKLVANKKLSAGTASEYKKVLESEAWPEVKEAWQKFRDEVEKVFKTPVEMKIFAYNEAMEKDTVMSPLDSLKYHQMILQTGIMAVDPLTGNVKVWIGGVNHKYFQFDHVTSRRQVGSTFKPFVYATAINLQGISPCFTVYDQPQTIAPGDGGFNLQKPWTPRNSTGQYTGKLLTLYEGLKKSVNTISVFLMKQLGTAEPVVQTVRQMGITSPIPVQPSISLGSCDLAVEEMTGAYTTFANNGIANEPIFISRIEDKNGRVIFQQLPEERQALSPNANYVMVDMLRYAAQGSAGFNGVKSEFGGKTGTTNDYVDGWFMGITPSLVVGTWVGGEKRWIRFRSIHLGQGARMARPFFSEFLKALEAAEDVDYDPNARFYRPPGNLGIEINCNLYKSSDPSEDEYEVIDFMEDQFGDENLKPAGEPSSSGGSELDDGEDF